MPYPKELLSPGETVVAEFRPHWSSILLQLVLTLGALVAVILLAVFATDAVRQWGPLAVAVIWLVLTVPKFIAWLTTQHVITNERVIHRQGFIAKHGKEIPHEMINTVSFSQSVFERMVGSGDLVIESAGEQGQTRYRDIPKPEQLQTLIYKAREERMFMIQRGGDGEHIGQGKSRAEQLQILSKLHDEGKLLDDEFNAQKAKILGAT
ncbi:MAG TPA: PH domain-containing protein [Acidimicrobiia bacterium]|nr:PH domain-containing protein [Acidimicrobiia bacterium]